MHPSVYLVEGPSCLVPFVFRSRALIVRCVGVVAQMEKMMELLVKHDSVVAKQLESQNLKVQYFAFRWLTLLLAQEFPLPGRNRHGHLVEESQTEYKPPSLL